MSGYGRKSEQNSNQSTANKELESVIDAFNDVFTSQPGAILDPNIDPLKTQVNKEIPGAGKKTHQRQQSGGSGWDTATKKNKPARSNGTRNVHANGVDARNGNSSSRSGSNLGTGEDGHGFQWDNNNDSNNKAEIMSNNFNGQQISNKENRGMNQNGIEKSGPSSNWGPPPSNQYSQQHFPPPQMVSQFGTQPFPTPVYQHPSQVQVQIPGSQPLPLQPQIPQNDSPQEKPLEGDNADRISAWHKIADPNGKMKDGLGTGNLHRRGTNYMPVSEAEVLAIQRKGFSYVKKGKKSPRSRRSSVTSAKSLSKDKGAHRLGSKQTLIHKPPILVGNNVNTPMAQEQNPTRHNPPTVSQQPQLQAPNNVPQNRNIQQQMQPVAPVVAQNLPSGPTMMYNQPSRPPPPNSQEWERGLVNEPFWEKGGAVNQPSQRPSNNNDGWAMPGKQSQQLQVPPYRYSSPAESPARSRSLGYIPPEFDETPYLKRASPSPIHSTAESETLYESEEGSYEDEESYGDQTDQYESGGEYDDEEEEEEYERNQGYYEQKVAHYGQKDPYQPSKPQPQVNGHSRGQLLLTINVELEDRNQAIEVHVNDDPQTLAQEFCELNQVTNPVVLPALIDLIGKEKEQRLRVILVT